jgi:putative FmdB family regulatory protein
MPIYVYRCASCSVETEKRQSFSDAPLTTCESCGGSLRRVLHPVGVIFKGSGWYSTDNRNGGKAKAADSSSGESSKPESSKSESSSSEAKPADASAAKTDSGDKAAASKTPAATAKSSE